jgi:signal transduction histidine kinase
MQIVTLAVRQFAAKAHATEHRPLRLSDARHRRTPFQGVTDARPAASAPDEGWYYRRVTKPAIISAEPRGLARLFAWRRVRFTLIASALWGLLLSPAWTTTPTIVLMLRTMAIGMILLLIFGLLEQWPRRLPRWVARWVLQVVGVAISVPFIVALLYSVIFIGDPVPFWENEMRMNGFGTLSMTAILFAPWIAMSALMRARDEAVRSQAVAFERERSALERKALDARLRLLQAQVEPHFLFNTLANVRELVESGSPQASTVLGSLIAYLRAAVPRLQEPATTLGQELQLVRAYLELMHMRMPDRLQFAIHAGDEVNELRCPPMTLLSLVENAVRHGIDPGEEGGRIDVNVRLQDGRVRAQVIDTGVGMRNEGQGLGTGLSTLRERLQLTFGSDAHMRLIANGPHGVCAEVFFPAQRADK